MVFVKLKPNVRYFESDDSNFNIQLQEKKEIYEKDLRSYSIKHHLFHGMFRILDDKHFVFKFKAATCYVDKDTLFATEYGKYFKKDLEHDSIAYVARDEVPKEILQLIEPEAEHPINEDGTPGRNVEVKPEPEAEPEAEPDFHIENMTKKELVAFAKENGLKDKINRAMSRSEMIEVLQS